MSILRIALKLHFVQNVEPDAEIGQKGAFYRGLVEFFNFSEGAIERFKWTQDEFGSLDAVQSEHIYENHYKYKE